jgi:hypothetical protein
MKIASPPSHSQASPSRIEALGASNYRIEALGAHRNRVLVERNGHTLAVSYRAKRPTAAALSKLRHALLELAEVA